MSLKLYFDLLSPPSRALYIFLKKCNIPFEAKKIKLTNGEQFQSDYTKIHPFNKVPAIEHNGFALMESVAIFRYICREFKIDNHWYPKNSKAQAKIDEYLEWQHLNTRLHCGMYFQIKYLAPLLEGKPAKPEKITEYEGRMKDCLGQIENVWLKDKPFLTGDNISIADLLGICEVDQTRMCGYDPRERQSKLSAWIDSVAKETSPYYEEANMFLNKVVDNYKEQKSSL